MTRSYFQRVRWRHDRDEDPVVLWAQVVDGWEVRKIDEFFDGRLTWADETHESGGTRLSDVPMPSAEEIGTDPQFTVVVIDGSEFERTWDRAHTEA